MATHLPPGMLHLYGTRPMIRGTVCKFGVPLHLGGEPVIFAPGSISPASQIPLLLDGAVAVEAGSVRLAVIGPALGFEVAIHDTEIGAKLLRATDSGYRATPVYAASSSRVHETAGQICEVIDRAHLIAISLDAGRCGGRIELLNGHSTTLEHDLKSGRFDGPVETGHYQLRRLRRSVGIDE